MIKTTIMTMMKTDKDRDKDQDNDFWRWRRAVGDANRRAGVKVDTVCFSDYRCRDPRLDRRRSSSVCSQ
jgi:hypothetical protein